MKKRKDKDTVNNVNAKLYIPLKMALKKLYYEKLHIYYEKLHIYYEKLHFYILLFLYYYDIIIISHKRKWNEY